VNAVLRRETPAEQISGLTMGRAIELAAYYLWQHRLIHTHNSPESGLAAVALKVQKYVERVGEVTASKRKSGVRALRSMAAGQIRQLMQTLANSGYGQVQGEGAEMKYAAMAPPGIDNIDAELTPMSIAETFVYQPVEPPVDTIDSLPNSPTAPISSEPEVVYQTGETVEVWRNGTWLPARYISTLISSVVSNLTQTLSDGHQVAFEQEPFLPQRVATGDLRLAQDLGPIGT
jgi:hypothetical protein